MREGKEVGGRCGGAELDLRRVEGDLLDLVDRGGEVGGALVGRVVAPGADGVEVDEKLLARVGGKRGIETSGEGFAVELGGEGVGEVLEHGEADQEGVARGPGRGGVVQKAKFDGQVIALRTNRCVDTAGVGLELVDLVGRQCMEGAIGGVTNTEGALEAVVLEVGRAEDFGELAGRVAADAVHLEEAVFGGDEALGEEEVVERCSADGGDAAGVAEDGDGGGKAGDGERSVDLREGFKHRVTSPKARADGGCGEEDQKTEQKESDDGVTAFRTWRARCGVYLGGDRGSVAAREQQGLVLVG